MYSHVYQTYAANMSEKRPPLSFDISPDDLAPPGIAGDLYFVPVYEKDADETGRERLANRAEREFELRALFLRESGFNRSVSADRSATEGTSFVAVPVGVAEMTIRDAKSTFKLVMNGAREISGVQAIWKANSATEARTAFVSALAPIVDHLSYTANVPIIVGEVVCIDTSDGTQTIAYTAPYRTVILSGSSNSFPWALKPILGLYREAKNSTSQFYRLLCYYKILEGIYRKLRPEFFKHPITKQRAIHRAKEAIPEHPELMRTRPDLVGKSIVDFFDNVLQKEFRDLVAHYSLESGTLLDPSDPEMQAKFANIILPAELACRVAIDQQIDYYRMVPEAGVKSPTS